MSAGVWLTASHRMAVLVHLWMVSLAITCGSAVARGEVRGSPVHPESRNPHTLTMLAANTHVFNSNLKFDKPCPPGAVPPDLVMSQTCIRLASWSRTNKAAVTFSGRRFGAELGDRIIDNALCCKRCENYLRILGPLVLELG